MDDHPPAPHRRLDDFGDFLTLAELAEYLGVSLRTLQRVRRRTPEQLPPEFRRFDRRPRYRREDVSAWCAAGRHESPALRRRPRA